MVRWLVALLLLGWGHFAVANSFYATPINASTPKYYGSSAFSAANAACKALWPPSGSWTMVGQPTADVGRWECRHGAVGGYYVSGNVYVYETCEGGSVASPGNCQPSQPNQCADKIGQQVSWDSSGVVYEGCVDKCSAALTGSSFSDSNSRRAYKPDVSEPVLFRNKGVYTGEACEGASVPIQTQDVPPTDFYSDDNCTATTPDWEGRQVSSCTTTDVYKDTRACVQAGGSLGNVNGMLTCVKSKGPTASQTTTQTQVTTEPTSDGGTRTTTQTTTTTKNCIGTNACTTTTTTNTTVNNTNADGTKGSQSSTCTGDNCGSDGKNTEGNGGKDSGTDDGKDDGENEQEGIEGPSDSLTKGDQGDFSEGISEWDQKIQDARDDLAGKIDQLSGQFSGVFDLNLGGGGGSLPCETVHVSFGKFGSTNLNLCLAAYDQYLSYLRYILLLAAAVLAAFIIMRN